MSGSGKIMTCEEIDKDLKHFVSDLMPDSDYQSYVEHLDSCARCKTRVRSMGSFSNQIWELADIEIPSDLDSTSLYQYGQAKLKPRKKAPRKSKKVAIGITIVFVGILAFGGKKFFMPSGTDDAAEDEAVIVSATPIKKKEQVKDPEAEFLYNQLKGMAATLEPVAKGATAVKKISEQAKESEKKVEEAAEQKVRAVEKPRPAAKAAPKPSTMVSSSNAYSLHWHIPYFTADAIKQLVGTIKMLNIELNYEDQNFIIFKTTAQKIKTISGGIQFTHKIELNLPEFIIDGSDLEREVVASISFTGREPTYSYLGNTGNKLSSFEQGDNKPGNNLDWHVLIVSGEKEALVTIIQRNRGSVLFTSKEAVIFSIHGATIEALSKELQTTGGMFVDFGDTDFGTVSLIGVVNVLVYFSAQ